jgi:FkbM family methyltransferase
MKKVILIKFREEGLRGVLNGICRTIHLKLSLIYLKLMQFQVRLMAAEAQARFKDSIQPVVPLDYAKGKVKIAADNLISFQRSRACMKEPETVRWIEENVKQGDVFYDIGANVGAYSFVADNFCKGDITVYAFEPSFSTFNQLCKNIMLNSSQNSIAPFMICLSESEKIEILNYYSTNAGDSKHTLGDNYIDCLGEEFSPAYNQQIFGYSIDSLVNRWGFLPPDHIKLDVDGTELKILRGAAKTLRSGAVKTVLVEISSLDPSSEEILAFLDEAGFSLDSQIQHGATVISNLIFKRTDH